ncbi:MULTISPECIES: hypothetical protein [unclassified Novosphingobium]|uniref:hypothetical protein n=1 Tax=unclassified Novosphingobium TaxID=2644732 RepID=UPI001ACA473E|nr:MULTISPECIES: hypothetical protein [unclassified Novosphingobium]MBN9143289.1 hypothetical protein [Novosphingobium sp.]MDR6706378.1 hypothetical protein [Novosphingobium sp. 1748]
MAFVSAASDAALDTADDRWTRKAMGIVALCFALNMADGMDLLVVSFIAPSLQNEWGVSSGQFAIVFSAGLAGMALGGLALRPWRIVLGGGGWWRWPWRLWRWPWRCPA